MQVLYSHCLILEQRAGTSKSGNDYVILRFLDEDESDVYEVFCFGDSRAVALPLVKGSKVSLVLGLSPDNRGAGVRVQLDGVGEYGLTLS